MTEEKISYKINGVQYDSLNEVPEEFRGIFSAENRKRVREEGVQKTYSIDGFTYHSLEDVPPEFRDDFRRAEEKSDTDVTSGKPPMVSNAAQLPAKELDYRTISPESKRILTFLSGGSVPVFSTAMSVIANLALWFLFRRLNLYTLDLFYSLLIGFIIGIFPAYDLGRFFMKYQNELAYKILPRLKDLRYDVQVEIVRGIFAVLITVAGYCILYSLQVLLFG